jgi:hypothetical protein
MKLFRICTEATGTLAAQATRIVTAEFAGLTVLRGSGYWEGIREDSIVFEIVADNSERNNVLHVADAIRKRNGQQAVCVQILDVELVSVTEKVD